LKRPSSVDDISENSLKTIHNCFGYVFSREQFPPTLFTNYIKKSQCSGQENIFKTFLIIRNQQPFSLEMSEKVQCLALNWTSIM
jgi:hypothetical protein